MANPHSVNDFFAAVDPVANRSFYGLDTDVEHQAEDIFKFSSDDEPIRSAVEYAGADVLTLKTENAAVAMKEMRQGPIKTWRAVLHAGASTISFEAATDTKNRYGKITSAMGALGRAAEITPQLICALWLDNCFNASNPADTSGAASADGLAVCSTSHLLPDGVTTFSNALASAAALDETSAEDIETQLRNMRGPDGNLSQRKVKGWIVPYTLFNKATKLSRNTKQSGTANNDPSTIAGTKVLPMDYLTSTTRYFAKTDDPRGLFWDWIQKKTFITDQVVLNLQKVYISFFRSRVGIVDVRGIFGVNAAV
jgi:hypothetical protein